MIRREISYIIGNDESIDEEYVIRNMRYNSPENFQSDVLKMIPLRIDIGAFFSADVYQNKNKVKDLHIKPVEREFVIDIDMNDYDHIRTCCSGKKLCKQCWNYVKAAYKVLKVIMEEAFGFTNILWVFSGRRGLHAWVCDRDARTMDKKLRSSVTEFLNFTISNDNTNYLVKKELIDRTEMYPTLQKAYNILKEFKNFLILDQKILNRQNIWDKLCEVVKRYTKVPVVNKDEAFKEQNQEKKLQYLLSQIEIHSKKYIFKDGEEIQIEFINDQEKEQFILKQIEKFHMEFLVGFLYPKIDSHVSAQLNHLLKCPFNIHSSSMKVSLPIANMDTFDIDSCVDINKLIGRDQNDRGPKEFKKALKHFELFVKKLKKEEEFDF